MSEVVRTSEVLEQEIARLNSRVATLDAEVQRLFRDQMAERAAHQALTEAEARFRDSFERSTVGQSLTGPDGKLLKVNQSLADMLGLSIQELQQANVADITHPDDIAKTQESFRCLLTNERTTDRMDKRYRHRDDHLVFVDVSVTLLRDGAGAPRHFVATIVDITERKRVEHALEASEARYRRLFEAAKDGILIVDADNGKIVDVNPFVIELTGYSHQDFLGKPLWEIGPFKDIAAPQEAFAQLRAEQYVRYEDLPLETRDGRKINVEIVSNVYHVDGRNVIQCNIRDITARKHADRQILEKNALLVAVLESVDFSIFSIDRTFRYKGFNRAYANLMKAICGVDIQVGDSLVEYQTVTESCQPSRKSLDRALQGENVLESVTAGDEGHSLHYFEVNYNPVLTDAGEIIGVSTLIRDVTAERQAADELRFNNIVLLTQQETSIDGMLVVDSSGKIVSSNRRFADIWGIARDVIESKSDQLALQSVLDKLQDPQDFTTKVNYLYTTDEKSRDEIALKDGRTFDRYSAPMLSVDGKRFGRVWYFRDITERKHAEEALKNSEAKLRAILDTTPFPVALVDVQDSYIKFWSRSAQALFGHAAPTVSEWYKLAYPDPDYRREVIQRWKPALEIARLSKQPVNAGEYRVTCRDGSVRNCELYVAFVPDGLIVTFNDITEHKRAEAERAKLEEQLRASQKMEAIGRLAGGVAHDFNNLLSVILMYNGFAMDGATDSVKDDLVEVKKAADRGVALVEQLLAFGRKQVLQPVPLDLSKVVAGVRAMLRRVLGEDIDLVQLLAPNVGLTLADPGQIEQVLMNLVVNARDAMPEGGKLTIETSNVEIDEQYAAYHMAAKPGSYVQLVVTDTGHGMDEQTRARIFEPFFTTKSNGTGLGLSTVYGIVKQSGGNIWVYSEPGTGTTFKIYLPREHSTGTATSTVPPPTSRRGVGAETILVVEDDEPLRNAAKRTLDAAGYKVLTAANGENALLTSAQHAGDLHLLLTDVVMPRMGGKALAEELSKARPMLKVLYMSGYIDNVIDQHGVLPAGTHFIGKPFTTANLTRKVREVLDRT